MALQARHRYVVTRLNEAFEVNDEEAVELIRRDSFLQKLNNFFGSRGPSASSSSMEGRLRQARATRPSPIKTWSTTTASRCTIPTGVTWRSCLRELSARYLCVFHEKSDGQGGPHSSLDPLKARDGCMVFGTVRDPMRSLEAYLCRPCISRCYKPRIK